jgi:peptidoglycan/LPS O-acetylase OafA/YrhL
LIRFGAAVAVTVYHLAWRVWEAPITTGVDIVRGLVRYDGWTFSSGGWIGVEVFFVISGLVIAFSAETATPWKFAKSRIVRIYPGAWLCASLSAVAIMILVKPPLGELAGQWFRSMVIYPPGDWLTGVYWTLAVEIAFYATVLAFLLLGAFDRISWLFAGLSVWSFAYLAYLAFIHFARVRVDLPAFVPNVLLLKHGCFFAVGGYLWLWSRKRITPVHWAFAVLAVVACGVEIAAKFDGHAEGAAGALVWLAVVGLMALSIAYNRYLSSPTVARLSRSLGLATYRFT